MSRPFVHKQTMFASPSTPGVLLREVSEDVCVLKNVDWYAGGPLRPKLHCEVPPPSALRSLCEKIPSFPFSERAMMATDKHSVKGRSIQYVGAVRFSCVINRPWLQCSTGRELNAPLALKYSGTGAWVALI